MTPRPVALSACCRASVRVSADFWLCSACDQPCELAEAPTPPISLQLSPALALIGPVTILAAILSWLVLSHQSPLAPPLNLTTQPPAAVCSDPSAEPVVIEPRPGSEGRVRI